MPRGGMKIMAPKPAKAGVSEASDVNGVLTTAPKTTKGFSTLKASLLKPTFLSRDKSTTSRPDLVSDQASLVQEPSRERDEVVGAQAWQLGLSAEIVPISMSLDSDEGLNTTLKGLPTEQAESVRPSLVQKTSEQSYCSTQSDFSAQSDLSVQSISTATSTPAEEMDEVASEAANKDLIVEELAMEEPAVEKHNFEDLTLEEEDQSTTSSMYSKDSTSIYSGAGTYSSASSMYSSASGASMYSVDERGEGPGELNYQQRLSAGSARRHEPQDAAARERSSLARKAAWFKNSRLRPQLPQFNASLPTWSMICRAIQASQDCYDSRILTRLGTYTPADTSKDIKAMIVDEQLIDHTRLIIVAIRGTDCKSLTDWTVNKNANPEKPTGFLDDEENVCHAGFLQVTKAMVAQVAEQLQAHPASSGKPALLFTGHSAGGAVAAMLYSHMLSTSVKSDLTAIASLFPSINCVTFGAPPLSLKPLPSRDDEGVFLSFANEGDTVTRLSNAAYAKSLAKLMTASPPASVAAPAVVKVQRRSRGSAVVRKVSVVPPTPWEDLPIWPTPAPPLNNAGQVILLRDKDNGHASASQVTPEDFKEVIFGDLVQHTIQMYLRRVKEVALTAMMGRD